MTSPAAISVTGAGFTTTRVPGGMLGSIELVSMTYGVAPASRGTISATSSAAPTDSITNQDTTSPTQRTAPGTDVVFDGVDMSDPPPQTRAERADYAWVWLAVTVMLLRVCCRPWAPDAVEPVGNVTVTSTLMVSLF